LHFSVKHKSINISGLSFTVTVTTLPPLIAHSELKRDSNTGFETLPVAELVLNLFRLQKFNQFRL